MTGIVDIARSREDIISLWHECFGDERDYIEFFLDCCPNKICLGSFDGNRLVSMLFLLNGTVLDLTCKYIYAACTAEEYRCRGIMGELIERAKKLCSDGGTDCIFLVPAEETLYKYYEKFGFIPKMKRAELTFVGKHSVCSLHETDDIKRVAELRNELLSSVKCFRFDFETTEYTVAEFLKTGGKIYAEYSKNKFLAFAETNGKNVVIKEFLTDFDGIFTKYSNLIENLGEENVYIHAPLVYNSSDNGCKGTKCGMLFPVTKKAKDCINEDDIFYSGMYLD